MGGMDKWKMGARASYWNYACGAYCWSHYRDHHKWRTELCSPLCSMFSCDWWYPLAVHCRQGGRKSEFCDWPDIFRLWPFSTSATLRDCSHRFFCLTFKGISYAVSNSSNVLDVFKVVALAMSQARGQSFIMFSIMLQLHSQVGSV